MMEAILKCKECSQVIGALKKPEITSDDAIKYSEMCDCDGGHKAIEVLIQSEETA